MNTDRIKEIQLATAHPESGSVYTALLKVWNETEQEQLRIGAVTCCTDLEWSLYKQVVELKEKVKKLEFMIENGLGWEDMRNDISMPQEL
jgi:hypothetical protein